MEFNLKTETEERTNSSVFGHKNPTIPLSSLYEIQTFTSTE